MLWDEMVGNHKKNSPNDFNNHIFLENKVKKGRGGLKMVLEIRKIENKKIWKKNACIDRKHDYVISETII